MRRQSNTASYSTVRGLLLLSLLSLVFVIPVFGSDPPDPKRGVASGAAYSISDIENINLTNGNLMLNMPLAKLPAGRGGLSGWLGLVYNSKLYKPVTESIVVGIDFTDQNLLYPSDEGGWRITSALNFQLKLIDRFGTNLQPIACIPGMQTYYEKNAYKWKLQVTLPDGSDKDFRPVGYGDQFGDGYFTLSPDGYQKDANFGQCSVTNTQVTTNPITYYSTDGSHIKLVVTPSTQAFTLYFPDGSYYQSSNGRLTDRYGNYIQPTPPTFTYDGKAASGIENSVGQKVFSTIGAASDETYFYQLGVGGDPVRWTVRWKPTFVRREYQTTAHAGVRDRGGSSTRTHLAEFNVVEEIELPSQLGGQSFEFGYSGSDTEPSTTYSAGWGEIVSLSMPSGAEVDYVYNYGVENTDKILAASVQTKTLGYNAEYDGASTAVEEVWSYSFNSLTGTSTVASPDGSVTTQKYYDYGDSHPYNGFIKSIENSNGKVEKIWATNSTPWGGANLFVKAEFSSIKNASGTYVSTAIKEFTQDKNGGTRTVKEYDFIPYGNVSRDGSGHPTGVPGGLTAARTSETIYYNSTPDSTDTSDAAYAYWNFGAVKSVVASSEIKDSSNQVVSKSEITYDNYSTTANPTLTRAWDNTKNSPLTTPLTDSNSVKTSAEYDSHGNLTETTDAGGTITEIAYGNVSGPNGNVTGLYPTQTIVAATTGVARTSTAVYDFYTGVVTTATDVDNNVSVVTEYDDLGRPVRIENANNTSLESWTQTTYDDADRRVIVKSDLTSVNDAKKVSIQHFDQLGRVRLSRTLENASTESATNEQHGIKVQTRYKSVGSLCSWDNALGPDEVCSFQVTSTPYRANYSYNETDTTMGWTLTQSQNDGLRSEVESFTGAALPKPFLTSGFNTNTSGRVKTEVDANATTVTDQADKVRRSITNGLGQLIRVDEPNSSGQLGSVSSPNQDTIYAYDTLNNLTTVTQGTQTRTFAYSSLSRLTSAANPESDSAVAYKYFDNGSLRVKTDARGVSTHFEYDPLNRITRRWYNGSSSVSATTHELNPAGVATTYEALYQYDQGTNGKGRLSKARTGYLPNGEEKWRQVTSNQYLNYDVVGRPGTLRQWIGEGVSTYYDVGYQYDLSGGVTTLTYPTGRTVNYGYDSVGRLSSMTGTLGDGTTRTYADSFQYTAFGGIQEERFGTTTPLYHKQRYNSRGQLWDMRLSTVSFASDPANGDRGAIVNDYGTTGNNGNVLSQDSVIPSSNFYRQSFTYDSLNRLKSVTEKLNGTGSDSYNQTFEYDRYGNRTIDASATFNAPEPQFQNSSLATANRLYSPGENLSSSCTSPTSTTRLMCYDAAGNMIRDKHVTNAAWMMYDGENKMVRYDALDAQTNPTHYLYDADGKRKQAVDSKTARYIHGLGGELLADANSTGVTKEYAYRNGDLLVTVTTKSPSDFRWLVKDHLGTPRIVADESGSLSAIKRHDYLPFGEEIGSTAFGRSTAQGYGNPQSDGVRQQFTGYERDDESGLDFAEARMFGSSLGRFTAVDPLMASGKAPNPQTWNRYAYVGNNPTNIVDPLGLDWLRSREKNKDGQYSYLDSKGEDIEADLKSGKWDRVDFEGSDSRGVFDSKGNLLFTMFAKGGFQDAPLVPGDTTSAIQGFVNTVADESETKGKTVAIAAGVSVAVGTGTGLAMAATGTAVGGTITTLGLTGTGTAATVGTGAVSITFTSHGAAHAATEGFSQVAAESAIRASVQNILSRGATGGEFWGKVTVGGSTIVYRAVTLADRTISIGTYYDPTKK